MRGKTRRKALHRRRGTKDRQKQDYSSHDQIKQDRQEADDMKG
jgi:hypothetical protein